MPYYYAPAMETENRHGDIQYDPGTLVGGKMIVADIPPSASFPHIDKTMVPYRFVCKLHPTHNTPSPGWEQVTAMQVRRDYPKLKGI